MRRTEVHCALAWPCSAAPAASAASASSARTARRRHAARGGGRGAGRHPGNHRPCGLPVHRSVAVPALACRRPRGSGQVVLLGLPAVEEDGVLGRSPGFLAVSCAVDRLPISARTRLCLARLRGSALTLVPCSLTSVRCSPDCVDRRSPDCVEVPLLTSRAAMLALPTDLRAEGPAL
jgi:hypothetical protein